MKANVGKHLVNCLTCGEKLDLGQHPEIGQIVTCKHCDAEMEIVDLEPATVDFPLYEEDEDEDLDYFDEDDDDEDYFDDDYEDDDYDDDDDDDY